MTSKRDAADYIPPRGHRVTIEFTGKTHEEAAKIVSALIAVVDVSADLSAVATNISTKVTIAVPSGIEPWKGYAPKPVRFMDAK